MKIIQNLLEGLPAAMPRLGFWVVDVRDLADLHIRAMTSPAAAGERFIAAGDFLWMPDIARTLRENLAPRRIGWVWPCPAGVRVSASWGCGVP